MNPVLPVIAWCQHWFTQPLAQNKWHDLCFKNKKAGMYVLPPVTTKSRAACAQKIMLELNKVPTPIGGGPHVIVSPESMFPYALNINSEEVEWWRSVLSKSTSWLFGATFVRKPRNIRKFQAAICLNPSPIKQAHIKQNCIDFFESCSRESKIHRFLNKLIGWKTGEFAAESQQGDAWNVDGVKIQPLLCSEALFAPHSRAVDLELVLFNETWFPEHIQKLFVASLAWRAWSSRMPTLAVGHKSVWSF